MAETTARTSSIAPPSATGAFGDFLKANGVEPDWYNAQAQASMGMKRFVRVAGHLEDDEKHKVTEQVLTDFEGAEVVGWWCSNNNNNNSDNNSTNNSSSSSSSDDNQNKKASNDKNDDGINNWDCFIGLPTDAKLKGNESYEKAKIYGMDIASAYAVMELQVKPGQRVLDLCCAPGAKFCMIADLMQHDGCLVGVDAAPARAQTCASICKKYGTASKIFKGKKKSNWECMVVVDDGVQFKSPWDANQIVWSIEAEQVLHDGKHGTTRKRLNKGCRRKIDQQLAAKRQRISKELEAKASSEKELALKYDRIIVDAECTHDGSLKHMQKYGTDGTFGEKVFNEKFLNADNCKYSTESNNLRDLQRGLIENGFKLLKSGGILVYSTCSFCQSQNEDIVQWLLDSHSDAKLLQLPENSVCKAAPIVQSKTLLGTVYFEPIQSGTSGLFCAKIEKL